MDTSCIALALMLLFVAANGELLARQSASATAENSPSARDTGDGLLVDERVMMGYSDSWVVEVEGGRDEADYLADELGFANLGQVGGLDGVYHFALLHTDDSNDDIAKLQGLQGKWVEKRKGSSVINEMLDKTIQLSTAGNVHLATQQKTFRKEKRNSFTYPSDPLWTQQWALFNINSYGIRGYDLNVVSAWIQGFTGSGVVVSVVDDGLQSSHPDLSKNFDSSASYNYMESTSDPSPYSAYDSHGTSCAGEIGMARDNSYCGVGVAYNCQLGGIRVNLNYLTDVVEARALSYQNNYIQVYSNSWGPPDNGFLVQGPGYYSGRVLKEGTYKGRDGLGSIWVWASGNGGRNDDSCAADGYASSMYTIAVGSASPRGVQAYYDEACSGKMAVTFSYNSNGYTQLVSTTPQNKCTTSFTGTSASAPLTAGVIALVLQSNRNLSWRDVQYLIAYTSDPSPFLSLSGWATNGAGLLVSHQFGFGAIDAEAMVTRAQHWTSVPQQRSCTLTPSNKGTDYATSGVPLQVQFSVSSDCSVVFLEHVVVQMTLSITVKYGGYYSYEDYYSNPNVVYHDGPKRGNIQVELYSPAGTRSILLPERQRDFVNDEGYYSWPFMSVHHWGEDPAGDWQLNVYFSSEDGYVTMGNLAVALYGTSQVPESVVRIPDQCDTECMRGCAAQGREYCDSCKNQRMLSDLRCVQYCPGEVSKQDVGNSSLAEESSDSCSMGGYCFNCKRRLLHLSIPLIALVTVSSMMMLVGTIAVSFILLTKCCRYNTDYISI